MNAVEDNHVTPTKELLLDDSENFGNNLKVQTVDEEACFDGGTLKVLCDTTSEPGYDNQTSNSRHNGVQNGPSPSPSSHWVEGVSNDGRKDSCSSESDSKEPGFCIETHTPKDVSENDEDSEAHNIFDREKEDYSIKDYDKSPQTIDNKSPQSFDDKLIQESDENVDLNENGSIINEEEKMDDSISSRESSYTALKSEENNMTQEEDYSLEEDSLKNNSGEKDFYLDEDSFSPNRDTADDTYSMHDIDEVRSDEGQNNVDSTDVEMRKSEECNELDNELQEKNEFSNQSSPFPVEPTNNPVGELIDSEPMDTSEQCDRDNDDDDLPDDALTIDTGKWSAGEDDEKSKHYTEENASHVPSHDDEKSKNFTEENTSLVPSDDDDRSKNLTEGNASRVPSDDDDRSKNFTEENTSRVPSDDDDRSKNFTEENTSRVPSDDDDRSKNFTEENASRVLSDDDDRSKNFTEENASRVPSDDDDRSKNFTEENASHFPSDDDVDPDALMIDTAPLDDEYIESNEVKDKIENIQKLPGQELKMTISLNKARMGVLKKAKRNINRIGRNANKNVKRRVQIPGDALRCPRCPLSSFLTVNSLIEHQEKCRAFSTNPVVHQANIPRGPRKVYMCSACGSYLENWDLFVHMKEMHKRNICLHCLGMFSQASKLIQHLATKHGVVDQALEYGDQLAEKFPGPQFLLCSRCDQMCTDKNFESHSCSTVCSHCGLAGTHYPTCRLAPPPSLKPVKTPKRRARAAKKPRKQFVPSMVPPSILTTPIEEQLPSEAPSPADDLSTTTHNERMLLLYRGKPLEHRSFSTLESIEETINRVVEESSSPKQEIIKNEENHIDDNNEVAEESSKEIVEEEEEEAEETTVPLPLPQTHYVPPPMPQVKSDSDSSDSERLTINLEPKRRQRVNYAERLERQKMEVLNRSEPIEEGDGLLAGEDTPFTCVPLPEPLDSARVPIAMKLFLRATALICVYCAHARKIAVNAKQLALHQLAQHRYITVADSTPALDKASNHASVVQAMRDSLPALENVYFNAYGFDSSDRSAWRSADRVYECFHCSYITPDLREFTLHNKKIHNGQSESHLCIMCKTRFLTYSELLCHLCCGVYVTGRIIDPNCRYRCYCCDIEPLPSSFRLMVHLRQTHTACDMCFTLCDSQAGLSAHVLKHKSLFYCYACAITYENRLELSKHIFWKHGAESVTCKRCLQKKWRHAYHFCLPPANFPCETCGSLFKTTAMLRVHSRLHTEEYPHACSECSEKFISKKLLDKHVISHTKTAEPPVNGTPHLDEIEHDDNKKKSKKDIRDFFDLPPVNLSESDDSSGDERTETKIETKTEKIDTAVKPPLEEPAPIPGPSVEATPAPAILWDGVLASLEEKCKGISYAPDSPFYNLPLHRVLAIALKEHDYCGTQSTVKEDSQVGREHDYCNNGNTSKPSTNKHSPRKLSKRRTRSPSSDSSSSSSSSCSCASNCPCSSSTSSTESASSGEPRLARKSKAEVKAEKKKKVVETKKPVEPEPSVEVCDIQIQESDLETDELVTDDEEFYELNPALRASEVLMQKRSILVDKLVPSHSKSYSHSSQPKIKNRKKRMGQMKHRAPFLKLKSPQAYSSPYPSVTHADDSSNTSEGDGKRPRRKRVPLKFYGFSSGEEDEMMSQPSRKKERLVELNTTIAASPPHTSVPSPQPEPSSNLWNLPSWRAPPVPPRVNPIKIRTGSLKQTFAKSNNSDEFHIKRAELGGFQVNGGPNSTDNGQTKEKLYCFCQCPYDEVSEMIACDAHDCLIEWFHFECVGIMDPPKGKWYCPDCKKKAAAESEMMSFIR